MDRDTIKNLLMTTSVLAIIAGSGGQEAKAANVCTVNVSGVNPAFTQSTNVNCINITNATVNGDVTIAAGANLGLPAAPNTVATNTELRINDSTISGVVINNGTITGNVQSGAFPTLRQFGIRLTGSSTAMNGVTNATTGVIDITVVNTDVAGAQTSTGVGLAIDSSRYAGNVVNNGAINVSVLSDPVPTALAHATGMSVKSTSFVGNVVNTGPLNVVATALASGTLALSTARARGISVNAGSVSGATTFSGAGTVTTSIAALFQGNVTNSGVINAQAVSTAIASSAALGASATGLAEGILVAGRSVTGTFTAAPNVTGTFSATVSDVFTGNITNNSTIQAQSTAFALNNLGGGPAQATSFAHAFGIRLLGDEFTGSVTSGSTLLSQVFTTVSADFAANITNTKLINATALSEATAFSGTGDATAAVAAEAAGIQVLGVDASGNVLGTGLGNITSTYNGTFAGNIGNTGHINANVIASGTAFASETAAVIMRPSGAGIAFVGANVSGTISETGSGIITNNLNATFLGNIANSGVINVNITSSGTALAHGDDEVANVFINGSGAGISVIGSEFRGNVVATASGSVDSNLSFLFSGNITNTSSGIINVTNQAVGISSHNVTGGEYIANVNARADGIRLLGASFAGNQSGNNVAITENVLLTGNVSNAGTIQANAIAVASVTGSQGASLTLSAGAAARGIAILGAVSSGRIVEGVGTFSGNVTNTGLVQAFATAIGRTTNVASTSTPFFQAQASADGIRMSLFSISGNVINSGSINAYSTAVVTVGVNLGNSQAFAFADGIDVRASTFTGSIGNSAGIIRVFATASNNDTGDDVLALADANGIYVNASSSFIGNVGNTGLLVVTADASVTPSGGTAIAVAAGISLLAAEQIGTVSNGAGGIINVHAIAQGNTAASATATGIAVDTFVTFGDVVNNGTIAAAASATAISGTTATASAHAAGIHVGDGGGPTMLAFFGNINNTGVMTAFATAAATNAATASAVGIVVANTNPTGGDFDSLESITGNIINSGSIGVGAFASSSSHAYALAAGMLLSASIFNGNVSNSDGTIVAQASAGVSTALGTPTATALAFGIAVLGATADHGFTSLFLGNVSNTGTINVSATASAVQLGGTAHAHGAGILLAGSATSNHIGLFGISTICGNITNSGLIMSTASAVANASAVAAAFGIEVLFSTFIGSVANTGTLVNVSTFSGSVGNAGTITATALATVTDGSVVATAGGIILAGVLENDGFFDAASLFSGNVTNSGLIWAFANATASTGTNGSGSAVGIFLDASTVVGSVTNTSTGIIAATANALVTSGPTAAASAEAFASGIGFFTSTFLGSVMNAGTIMANASANASGSNANAEARAYGIRGANEFFSGNILNTGFIGAYATAFASGDTHAVAFADVAGIDLQGDLAIGTIANTGTLVQVSTFAGNVKNAGTIMAIGTAIARSNTAAAVALDPATGIRIEVSSFFGVVQNSGLIVAQATADAAATGPTAGATAIALAAGIGINFPVSGSTGESLLPTILFEGAISNNGTILVNASAHASAGASGFGRVVAGATGIRVFSSFVSANISNSGFIQATATAINDSANNSGTAFAAGIHIGGIYGASDNNFAMDFLFVGNITNSGTILAQASSTTQDNAFAAGIQVDTSFGFANIDNTKTGLISANAFVSGGPGAASATAVGIYLHTFSFTGNITNEGTVIAVALATNLGTPEARATGINLFDVGVFFGNVANSGIVMANASALNGNVSAFATAIGIQEAAAGFFGDIDNNGGTIAAYATAQANSGAGPQTADAFGINVIGSLFVGNVNNSGLVFAKVSAPGGGGTGTATGIFAGGNTFAGNVTNTGTIVASADGTGMHALGVHVESATFIGNVNNFGGLIIAAGDATGIYSNPGTFVGAINNTGTIIGMGGSTDRGIRVVGASIEGGINNSGTVVGGFASVDLDEETGPGTTINNQSKGLLKGDVRLSSTADTLNVFGGSTVMGNISGNTSGTGPSGIGNADIVNFDLKHDGMGGTLGNGFTVYQYKITNVDTVNLITGTLVLDDQDVVGTVTLGPGNIDPVGNYNQTACSTLGLVVDVGHPATLGPSTAPAQHTLTITSGIGFVSANTVNISTGASFKAFEEADYYANVNIYPDVVVGLTSMNGNYLNDGTHVLSNSPLFDAFMIETGGTGPAGNDTLVLSRRAFNNPLGVGLTPNENAAGGGLEGLYKTGNGTAMAILPPLFTVPASDYALVLKSLDGETILERPDLWQTVLDSILHRLSQGEGFNGQGFAGAMLNHGPIQVASAGFSDTDNLAQMTPMPGANGVVQPWSVWARGYGVTGSAPSTINATSFDEKRYGGIGGVDYHVTNNLLVGGIFNYAHGEVDLDAPTTATNKQDAYQFAAYGKYQQGPWYVNAIVGGGFTNNTEQRTVLIPVPAAVNGSYNGKSFTAYGEAGWDLYPMSNVRFTPLVGVGYNWLRYDGFQESGSPSALSVNAATTTNLYTALGARAQTAINIGTAAPLVPEVRVVWQHEFLDANQEMNAAFGGGTLFNVQGSKFSRESVIAGVGLSNNVAPDLKLFLDYDAKVQGGYIAHAVSAGFRWSFGGAMAPPPPAAPPPMPAAQPAPPPAMQAQTFVVYFDFDKSALTPEAMGIIKQAAAAYKQTGAVNIKVDGYTDLAGTAQYNVGLSKRRADIVRTELVKDGVPNNAVAEAWHGKDNPAVPTPDGVREPRNRRATIMLP